MYGHLMSIFTQAILLPVAIKVAPILGRKLVNFFERKLNEYFSEKKQKEELESK